VFKLFWDNQPNKIKESFNQFETMSDLSLKYMERSIGIINPIDHMDWLEIIFILIAQVSKRVD